MQTMRDLLRSGLGRALREWEPLDRLTAAWPVAAGTALAAHGTPTSFDDGMLTIMVDDATWLAQMLPLRGQLARELASAAGVAVREIHFREAARDRTARVSRPGGAMTPKHGGRC